MFEKQIAQDTLDHTDRLEGYHRAEKILARLNLHNLDPLSTRMHFHMGMGSEKRDTHADWNPAWRTNGIIYLSLYFHWSKKEDIREIVFASNIKMEKRNWIERSYARGYRVFEAWSYEEEELGSLEKGFDLQLVFYRPVEEGEIINGCEVKMVENITEKFVRKQLAISCEREV